MKKLLCFFLILSTVLVSLVSCGHEHDWEAPSCTSPKTCSVCGETQGRALGHSWKDATCTEAKKCSRCGVESGVKLGHTTSTGTCSRCGENFSSWELGEFVDEFNQPTGKKYVASSAYGTFSNSATTNSKLYASVQVTSTDIAFMLWEYGSSLVKGIFDSNSYSITVLDSKGVKHYFHGRMYENSSRVYVDYSDKDDLLNLLKSGEKLSFYLVFSKYTTSSYLFSIDTTGFSSLYSNISGS